MQVSYLRRPYLFGPESPLQPPICTGFCGIYFDGLCPVLISRSAVIWGRLGLAFDLR